MTDDLPAATRARLERLEHYLRDTQALEWADALHALLAAQAQAAPVLAAATAFEPFMERVAQGEAIPYPQRMRDEARRMLDAWRAAREG